MDRRYIKGITGWTPAYKLGRLANGAERGGGHLIHALMDGYSPEGISYGTSVCGASIGSHSAGWKFADPLTRVTCLKCLKRFNSKERK